MKKVIFQDMKDLDLAQKAQLRYIIHHVENISDLAKKQLTCFREWQLRL